MKFNVNSFAMKLSSDYTGDDTPKFEPRHNSLPVMIYVGGVEWI